jgi:3-methyl-2-oxobutanoate hydroxymethyltransferase
MNPKKKLTTPDFQKMKADGKKIVMVTAYDYPGAQAAAQAGVDLILVGDTLGMVVLGYDSTVHVTMDDMIHHARAVKRGAPETFIVGDMPFLSCQISIEETVRNVGRMIQEGGVDAVKIEGGAFSYQAIEAACRAQVPVIGHLGLTPQSVYQLGGYKVQGKKPESAAKIIEEARHLQELGIFMLVLECVPSALGSVLAKDLQIPVIGIGAGDECDGQVLVYHDLLGMQTGYLPKFAKQYQRLYDLTVQGIATYADEVRNGIFPGPEEQYASSQDLRDALEQLAKDAQ